MSQGGIYIAIEPRGVTCGGERGVQLFLQSLDLVCGVFVLCVEHGDAFVGVGLVGGSSGEYF